MHLAQILPQRWRELMSTTLAEFAASGRATLLRLLPERLHNISHELAKFGMIGLANLIVNFAVFNLLWFTLLRDGELKAKAVATIVATTCAYFMNRHWTYRDRPKSTLRREYSLFVFFNAVGLVIEVAVIGIAKYGFDQTHIVVLNLVTALGVVLGTVFRFWAYRTHVFKLGPDVDAAVDAEPAIVSAAAAMASLPDPAMVNPEHPVVGIIDVSHLRKHDEARKHDKARKDEARKDEAGRDELTQLELDALVGRAASHPPVRARARARARR